MERRIYREWNNWRTSRKVLKRDCKGRRLGMLGVKIFVGITAIIRIRSMLESRKGQ